MLEEQWKPIKGCGRYLISNYGRIKSLVSNKLLKIRDNGKYQQVKIFNDERKAVHPLVHRLVCAHFLENPNNLPCVNHKDENRYNNFVENLEWCSHKDNCNYGTRNERMAKSKVNGKTSKAVLQYDMNGNFIKEWKSSLDAQETGVCRSAIQKCAYGIHLTSNGFMWLYKTDDIESRLNERIAFINKERGELEEEIENLKKM